MVIFQIVGCLSILRELQHAEIGLRVLDVVAAIALVANVFILGGRAYNFVRGNAEGDYLLVRTVSVLIVSAAAIVYLFFRYRSRSP